MPTDVVLVYPGKKEAKPLLPLPVLYLAGVLEENGYKVTILDTRIHEYSDVNLDRASCVGISTITGSQILYGLEVAKYVRKNNPDVPLIWGGIHPSLLPEQTIENENVDIVVREEGELTMLELVQKLEAEKALKNVKGITYKLNGKIINNPDRDFVDLNTLNHLPYHLIDIKKYSTKKSFAYQSSRGCPYNCIFCYNLAFNKRWWRYKNSDKVLDELDFIVTEFDPESILVVDDNFFVSKKRLEEILLGVKRRNFDFTWHGSARADYISQYEQDFMKLLKDSGCKTIGIGGESGSEKILNIINKGIAVNQIINSVEKCKKVGIKPIFSFICGFPEETREDLNLTLSLIDEIKNIYKDSLINGFFLIAPLPGTPMFELAKKYGFKPPTTLEEWGNWKLSDKNNTPWLDSSTKTELETVSHIVRFNYLTSDYGLKVPVSHARDFLRLIYKIYFSIYKYSAEYRWTNRYFKNAIEWKLWQTIRYLLFKQH